MKKITLFAAALLTAGSAFSALKVEKVWESTSDIPAVADARQGVGRDGTVYVQDKGTTTVWAYTKSGETVTKTAYVKDANASGCGIAIDDAGNMILVTGWAGSNPSAAVIVKAGDKTTKSISFTLDKGGLTNVGRTDYITATGDIWSAEGGLIYYYANLQTQVNYVKVTNGAATAADVTTGVIKKEGITTGGTVSVIIKGTDTTFVGQSRSAAWQELKADGTIGAVDYLDGVKNSTVGGCTFTINGKEIWAYNAGTTSGYTSEFKVRNVTDGVDINSSILYIVDQTTAGTSACANWLSASKIDDNSYYIHQYCPNKGIGLWKVTDEGAVNVENVKVAKATVFATAEGLQAEFDGEATVEIFSTTGKLIQKSVANNVFNTALRAGAYLVRINGETYKFVK